MSQDDRECIRRSLNSHPEAFGGLVKRYQAALLAYLVGRVGDATQAEDATQETLVRAFFSLDKLKKPESFFSWLLGIAKRVANEQRRAERRHRKELRLASERDPSQSISHHFGLEEAVAGLPDSYREIILLRYYAGCPAAKWQSDWRSPWARSPRSCRGPTRCCGKRCNVKSTRRNASR